MISLKNSFLLICIMVLQVTIVANSVENPNIKFKQANDFYEKAKYKEAIELYNEILKVDYVAPELYFNLGNAHYKNDEIAAAILNYEKALKLKPDYEDALFNLKMANQQTIDKIDRLPELFIDSAYKNFVRSRTIDGWAYLTVGLFFVSLLMMISYLLSSNGLIKKTGFYGGMFFVLVGFICWFMAFQHNQLNAQNTEAIVFAKSVEVNSEPNISSQKLFTLHEGIKVTVLEKHNEWAKIKLPNGHVGWLPSKEVETI